jgi:mono/diheme cytochrome c family protein
MSMQKQWSWKVLVGVGALAVATTAAIVSVRGVDVSVTTPHPPVVERGLRAVMEHSVREQAQAVRKPAGLDLGDPALAARAFGHYSAACRTCHGAPGAKPDPWMVIYPAPPDLTKPEVVAAWSDEELFWILKHGVKDTGMMALGPTHQDKDIWAVTAFVRQLPSMPAERYAELAAEQRAKEQGAHDHAHH